VRDYAAPALPLWHALISRQCVKGA
jgi:hypothetical protein